VLSASELQLRGKRAADEGRLAQARRWSRLALEREPSPDVRAEALLQLAMVEAETTGLEWGLELCRQAQAVASVSDLVRGHVHARVGLLSMRSGDLATALAEFGTAEPLLRDDPEALTGLLINRGNISLQRQQLDGAAADFLAAMRTTGSPIERAKAQHNLGYAEYLRGNLTQALALMSEAGPVLDPLSPAWRAVNESDRAEVLSACGMTEQAAAALERAAHAFALRRLRQSQGEAELARARILLERNPAVAGSLARQAARRFRLRGSEDWALRADVVALGADVALARPSGRRFASALHPVLATRDLGVEAKTAALYAATAALRAGEVDEASDWVARAGVGIDDSLETRLLDRQARAKLAALRDRPARAAAELRAGLDDLHDWLSAFGSLDLQSSLVGRGRGLAAYGLELAVAEGGAESLFEWFERARVLVSRVTPVQPPETPEAEHDLALLRREQSEGKEDEELKTRIRQRAWYAPSIGRSAQPVSLAELQQRLRDDALLALALTEGRLTALVVTSNDTHVVPLGSPEPVLALLPTLNADLDMGAAKLPEPIAQAVAGSLHGRLATVSSLLLDPIAGLLGGGRVVVVPAGALAGVPWSLLPGLRGRPVTVTRSATHWCARADESPVLETAGFVTGPGVPRSADEVHRAAAGWGPGARQVALDGSAEEVNAIAGTVDVLHVAAHGRHSADNPLFSGIELTGGPWFGYDIDQLPRVPSVVLLSACELGRSTVRGAEELVGMTTAWLHAGTRCVIASPTAVNDEVAADLLPRVHRGLAAGAAPAEALAEAMSQTPGLAAFTCYGSGW
jgi:tetratricopeptide (TPR) repeat protein